MAEFVRRSDELSSITDASGRADDAFDATSEQLWAKLHELESVAHRLTESIKMTMQMDTDMYVDVGGRTADDHTISVLVDIPQISTQQSLYLSAICITPYVDESDFMVDQGPRPDLEDHNAMRITLQHNDVALIQHTAKYFRSEYSLLLDNQHADVVPGRYTITITNQGLHMVSLRMSMRVIERERAITIRAGETLRQSNRSGEFTYFRFENPDPSKLITIRAQPVHDDDGPIGDPDLYVSNRCHGYTPVTKDTFVWKSTNVGADRVDIHPDDPEAQRGDVYMIGVLGYKEHNVWELSVQLSDPVEITKLTVPADVTMGASVDEPVFMELKVDTSVRGQIVMNIVLVDDDDNPIFPDFEDDEDSERIDQNYGRGVYASDSLFAGETDPSNVVYPVVYMSNSCMYPSPEDYTWRASHHRGHIMLVFESDEWKYTPGICYIGVYAHRVGSSATSSEDDFVRCRLIAQMQLEDARLTETQRQRYAAFNEVFAESDGSNVSQKDRAQLNSSREDTSFTYGEVEFLPFSELLAKAGAKDGDVFFDLGCGAGKAIIAAALSPVRFSKVVGVELLPGLCELARTAASRLREIQNADMLPDDYCSGGRSYSPVEVVQGDMLQVDWSHADVMYLSSICFSDEIMMGLAERTRRLKSGTRIITLKHFPKYQDEFEIISSGWYKMTWGRINVLILKKL